MMASVSQAGILFGECPWQTVEGQDTFNGDLVAAQFADFNTYTLYLGEEYLGLRDLRPQDMYSVFLVKTESEADFDLETCTLNAEPLLKDETFHLFANDDGVINAGTYDPYLHLPLVYSDAPLQQYSILYHENETVIGCCHWQQNGALSFYHTAIEIVSEDDFEFHDITEDDPDDMGGAMEAAMEMGEMDEETMEGTMGQASMENGMMGEMMESAMGGN